MTRSARFKLIDWVLNDDMEGLEELGEAYPCAGCGQPVRTFSLSFHAAFHLRCCVRLWELFEAENVYRLTEAAYDRLRGACPPAPGPDDLPF